VYTGYAANGGGLHIAACTSIAFSGNTINANTADLLLAGDMNGGGIYLKDTNATMDGDVVSNNIVGVSGSLGDGGGVYALNSGVTATGVTLQGNQANTLGGGMYADVTSTLSLSESKVLSNSALLGGGVYAGGPSSTLNHNLWVGNTGRACYFSSPGGSFIGNTMDVNSGIALYLTSTTIPVVNNLVTNTTGSGIRCAGTPRPTPTYCDVWNNTTDYDGCTPGTGCISLDPVYVNAAGGDYHVGLHSPAIDSGDPDPGRNDPDGSRGDMGVYGSHAFAMEQPEYPKNFSAAYIAGNTVLKWSTNLEPDVASYAVYKDTDPDFVPSTGTFVILVAAPDTTYDDGAYVSGTYYKVSAIDADGYAGGYAGPIETDVTGIGEGGASSYAFRLDQNRPNPFNPTTRIRYEVGTRSQVSLDVFDVRGGLVKRVVSEEKGPGSYTVEWDGTNANGERVSTGVYFYRLTAGTFTETRKMVLLK
jgi:hypothetical protein